MSRRAPNRFPPAPAPASPGVLNAAEIARWQAKHRLAFWLGAGCFGVGVIGACVCKSLGLRLTELPLWATAWILLFAPCAPGLWLMSVYSWRKGVPATAYLLATITGLGVWVATALAISWWPN